MSHHHHHHEEECGCQFPMMYGMGGGYGGYGEAGIGKCSGGAASSGIRWIYALLILIVIVLQFGRKEFPIAPIVNRNECGEVTTGVGGLGFLHNNQMIDNSVLFIIVVFLLILCAGCFGSGFGGGGAVGYGY